MKTTHGKSIMKTTHIIKLLHRDGAAVIQIQKLKHLPCPVNYVIELRLSFARVHAEQGNKVLKIHSLPETLVFACGQTVADVCI